MADEGQGSRVWLITGASRGLGRAFAQAALDAGDAVVLTARDPGAVEILRAAHPAATLALELDVTDRAAAHRAVARAIDAFGRIDVLVNSAGYGLHASVEETTEREAREQMETNFFGALWVTQAAMAVMRRQRSGHILQVSSAAGGSGFPMVGLYCASKFALEGMTEALALEAERFGIAVTIVAPSDFRTGSSRRAEIARSRSTNTASNSRTTSRRCRFAMSAPSRATRSSLREPSSTSSATRVRRASCCSATVRTTSTLVITRRNSPNGRSRRIWRAQPTAEGASRAVTSSGRAWPASVSPPRRAERASSLPARSAAAAGTTRRHGASDRGLFGATERCPRG